MQDIEYSPRMGIIDTPNAMEISSFLQQLWNRPWFLVREFCRNFGYVSSWNWAVDANCRFRVFGYVPELGSPNMFHYISRKPLGLGGLHFESCCITAYLFCFPLSYHGKGHILLSLWMGYQCVLTPWQVGPEQQELLGISPNTYHPFINLGELPFWWMVGGSRRWFSRKDHISFAQIILTRIDLPVAWQTGKFPNSILDGVWKAVKSTNLAGWIFQQAMFDDQYVFSTNISTYINY